MERGIMAIIHRWWDILIGMCSPGKISISIVSEIITSCSDLRSGEDLTCRNLAILFILNSMQRKMDTFKTEYAIGKQHGKP
jgi:hypothetical protein